MTRPDDGIQPALRRGYLGLGSNIGERRTHLLAAIAALRTHRVLVEASSSTYATEPVGLVLDQPEFLNACIRIATELGPEELLDACKETEREVGRAAGGPRHGPRVIDVDLLLLGDLTYTLRAADAAPRRGQLAAVRARAAARARSGPRPARR